MTVEEAKAADQQDIIEWLRHHVRELESAHGVYKAAAVRHGRAAAGVADQLPTEDAKC